MIKRPDPSQRPIVIPLGTNDTSDETTLLQKRQQVGMLKVHERELHELHERECELEVERIAAEVALRALKPREQPDVAPGMASEIIQSLDHSRTLARKLQGWDQRLANGQETRSTALEQLQAGIGALQAWLEAPRVNDLQQTRRALRAVLFTVTFGAIGAGLTVHPAFFLLLLPIGPIMVLLRSGQNVEWRRLGAKRRFRETGLEEPAEWAEQAVRRRLAQLQKAASRKSLTFFRDHQQANFAADSDPGSLEHQLSDENQNLVDLLAASGLNPSALDADLEQRLRLVADVERSRRELGYVQKARKSAAFESNQVREQLFAYLARQGNAPSSGHADTETLAARVEHLMIARRGKGSQA